MLIKVYKNEDFGADGPQSTALKRRLPHASLPLDVYIITGPEQRVPISIDMLWGTVLLIGSRLSLMSI